MPFKYSDEYESLADAAVEDIFASDEDEEFGWGGGYLGQEFQSIQNRAVEEVFGYADDDDLDEEYDLDDEDWDDMDEEYGKGLRKSVRKALKAAGKAHGKEAVQAAIAKIPEGGRAEVKKSLQAYTAAVKAGTETGQPLALARGGTTATTGAPPGVGEAAWARYKATGSVAPSSRRPAYPPPAAGYRPAAEAEEEEAAAPTAPAGPPRWLQAAIAAWRAQGHTDKPPKWFLEQFKPGAAPAVPGESYAPAPGEGSVPPVYGWLPAQGDEDFGLWADALDELDDEEGLDEETYGKLFTWLKGKTGKAEDKKDKIAKLTEKAKGAIQDGNNAKAAKMARKIASKMRWFRRKGVDYDPPDDTSAVLLWLNDSGLSWDAALSKAKGLSPDEKKEEAAATTVSTEDAEDEEEAEAVAYYPPAPSRPRRPGAPPPRRPGALPPPRRAGAPPPRRSEALPSPRRSEALPPRRPSAPPSRPPAGREIARQGQGRPPEARPTARPLRHPTGAPTPPPGGGISQPFASAPGGTAPPAYGGIFSDPFEDLEEEIFGTERFDASDFMAIDFPITRDDIMDED